MANNELPTQSNPTSPYDQMGEILNRAGRPVIEEAVREYVYATPERRAEIHADHPDLQILEEDAVTSHAYYIDIANEGVRDADATLANPLLTTEERAIIEDSKAYWESARDKGMKARQGKVDAFRDTLQDKAATQIYDSYSFWGGDNPVPTRPTITGRKVPKLDTKEEDLSAEFNSGKSTGTSTTDDTPSVRRNPQTLDMRMAGQESQPAGHRRRDARNIGAEAEARAQERRAETPRAEEEEKPKSAYERLTKFGQRLAKAKVRAAYLVGLRNMPEADPRNPKEGAIAASNSKLEYELRSAEDDLSKIEKDIDGSLTDDIADVNKAAEELNHELKEIDAALEKTKVELSTILQIPDFLRTEEDSKNAGNLQALIEALIDEKCDIVGFQFPEKLKADFVRKELPARLKEAKDKQNAEQEDGVTPEQDESRATHAIGAYPSDEEVARAQAEADSRALEKSSITGDPEVDRRLKKWAIIGAGTMAVGSMILPPVGLLVGGGMAFAGATRSLRELDKKRSRDISKK